MNKYLQRIFLTALVALLGGVNAAWADTFEVLYGVPSYDTDGSTILSVAPQDDFTGDANELTGITHSDANGTNCTDAMPIDGSVLNLKADWTKDFSAPVTSGKVVFVANYTVSANNSKTIKIVDSNGYAIYESSVQTTNGNANQDVATICGTAVSNWVRQARSAHYGVKSLVIDLDARTVSYELIASSGNNSFSTLTGTVNIPAEVTDVKGMSVTKTNYDAYLDHVAFYSQVSAEVKYRYTVNYTYNDEVVRVIGGNVVAGTVINTERVIYGEADNTKYIVVAEELPTLTVTAEGDNILNVPVRLAVKYGYTVTSAYDGQALPFTATGEVWEDENTAKVSYPRYQLSGTQLVTKAPNGNDLQESITVASDGFTQVFDYTAVEGIDNICLLSEAEDLGTTLSSSATSFTTRVSNGQIIYGAKGDLLTLPAGKYIFTLGTIGGDSNSHQVNYELYKEATPTEEGAEHNADNKIGEGTCTGNTLKLIASDEFELTEETVISFTCSDAASTRGIDLVYVQKTGDVEPPFDITTVITNGDFEGEYTVYSNPSSDRAIYQPAGWTLTYENGEVNDMTALNSSCLSWNSFSGKPQPTNGDNNSYWVRFRWGNSEQLTLSQTVTLSAGEYRLTADAFFNGATGASATISAGDASTSITGNSTWANYAVDFTLNEDTDVTIALNVKQTSQVENIAAFDNFKINFLSDIVKALLQEEIAAAEALKTEARTEGLADFNAAIDAAKALLTSTDASAINAAVEALKQAEEAYLTANLPVAKGTYYVYNPLTKKFLSRGNAYGTAATVDDYGVAVNVAVSDLTAGNYTLSSFDIGANYG
ncbi:MAG: hypothetical protein IJ612_00955, partial [Prevotella sp.]|nr:hypothetical protein [Prevotella sp.]